MSEFDYGTGRRENATARTRLYAGNGAIEVNGRKVEDYFPRKTLQMIIRQPLVLTKLVDKFNMKVNVCGGGVTGQAEAVRHGISRALLSADPSLRGVLKRPGFLTPATPVRRNAKSTVSAPLVLATSIRSVKPRGPFQICSGRGNPGLSYIRLRPLAAVGRASFYYSLKLLYFFIFFRARPLR